MLGTYPVMIDGAELGVLNVRQDGIMTVFEAQCADTGALVRLSVYGEKEGYLGVMLPNGNGQLTLHKRMSRAALQDFPATIQFAGLSGIESKLTRSVDTAEPLQESPDACAEELPEPEQPEEAAPLCEMPMLETPDECHDKASPEAVAEMQWRRGAGGALIGTQGNVRCLAVPLKSGVAPVGGNFEKRRINNVEYAVFEIKNGKII